MKESTSFSFSANEMEVTSILLQLPRLIHESEFTKPLFSTWGLTRKRSGIESASRFKSPPPPQPQRKTLVVIGPSAAVKVGASSPDTPLSFLPSDESDERAAKQSKKILSLKRKREDLMLSVEQLTNRRVVLQQEVENVKSYYDEQKSLNMQLKQQLIRIRKKTENSRVEINHYHHYPPHQQQQQHRIVNQQPLILDTRENQSRQIFMQPSTSSTGFRMANDNVGPHGIPDLNRCPEESDGVMEVSQPSDQDNVTKDNKSLMAAEARQKRRQICRFKNNNNSNSNNNNNSNSNNNNNNNNNGKLRYYPYPPFR